MNKILKKILVSLNMGFFLALRDIRRSNIWTTVLISFVMTLTFLNLVVVRGVLVGLTQGSVDANKFRYSSNIFLTELRDKDYIEDSTQIVKYLESLPQVDSISARYLSSGKIESGYKTKIGPNDIPNFAVGQVAGIDPDKENAVTGLSKYVINGQYLNDTDDDKVLVGSSLLFKYTAVEQAGSSPLKDADVGDKIRLTVGNKTIEVTIKGVLKGKISSIDNRIIMMDRQLRQMIGRSDLNASEISIKIAPGSDEAYVKSLILNQGFDRFAVIQTSTEALPKFVKDIAMTFSLLGDLIGSIGLAVATITIFIVIFVNAITRRKYIGILKGIGINATAIEFSYVFQALFYAITGIGVGMLIVFLLIKPYFDANPINFPFSDGILVASMKDVLQRAALLMASTAIAGFLPARIIVKQNTLDAILGR